MTAVGTYTDGSTGDVSSIVDWSSSDTSIASVDNSAGNKGSITTLSTGSFVIAASHPGAGLKGKADLQVIDSVLEAITVTPPHPTLYIGKMKQFTAVGSYSNGSEKTITERVKWSSSDPTISSVRNSTGREGLANSHAVGKVTITATDPKTGIFSTNKYKKVKDLYNHQIETKKGLLQKESSAILKQFFKERRGAGAAERGGLENR